ncbi:MAG: HAD-IA family hydrolase [Gammaproteobacteria bacterium]|nr:HAD-IA family hydrolase [Gammaproteobacteria bacterium]
MTALRTSDYDVFSFDCYGTLVDWEKAIVEYLQSVLLAHDVHVFDGTILEFYAEWEPLEQRAGGSYRDVLTRVMGRYGSRLGFTATSEESDGFIQAIARAPAFEDTPEALTKLSDCGELAIISNTDSDLIQETIEPLPVEFQTVVTAQDLGAYKPNLEMLKKAFDKISAGGKRILHVAESSFHDIAPASELGFDTVWIQRSREHSSATQNVEIEPTWVFSSLAELVDSIESQA